MLRRKFIFKTEHDAAEYVEYLTCCGVFPVELTLNVVITPHALTPSQFPDYTFLKRDAVITADGTRSW